MSIETPLRRRVGARLAALFSLALVGAVFTGTAAAQEAAPVAVGELQALVDTLENAEQRAELVQQLKTLIEAQRSGASAKRAEVGASVLAALSTRVEAITENLIAATEQLAAVPSAVRDLGVQWQDAGTRGQWLRAALKLVLVLIAALVAEWLARRALRGTLRSLEAAERDTWFARAVLLLGRAALDLACIAAFALAAYGVLSISEPRDVTRLIGIALINASVAQRAVMVFARLLLSPSAQGLRLWPMSDETANYWALWLRRFANVGIYGFVAIETALLLGLDRGLHALLIDLLGLVLAVMLVVLIRQLREDVAALIRPGDDTATRLRRRLAELWHVAAILYVIAAYVVWATDTEGGFRYLAQATVLTLVVVGVAGALLTLSRRLIDRLFTVSEETTARYPGLEARANRYVSVVHRVATVLVYVIAALAVAQAWQLDALAWLGGGAGRALLGTVVTIAAIVIGSLIIWEAVSAAIEAYIARAEQTDERGARLRTLLPLARKALAVVLVLMATLTTLSELGINIAPLLAGAGVVGLAVGFGAQTLVKDVITGVFILVEDSIQVGDVVEAGGHTGVVETLSIRTINLRDLEGRVHVVPFSDVTSVLNYTKDFSFSLLDIGVAYRENVDEVIEVLTRLGEELQADETHGPNILEPLQVLGLNSLDDSAVTIRARFKTAPGTQWATRREFLRRVKQRFDELGIEIPFPHQTIWFGVDKEGKAPAAPVQLQSEAG